MEQIEIDYIKARLVLRNHNHGICNCVECQSYSALLSTEMDKSILELSNFIDNYLEVNYKKKPNTQKIIISKTEILKLRAAGKTLQEIAEITGVTRSRIHQLTRYEILPSQQK